MKRGKPLKRSSTPLKRTPLRRSRPKSSEEVADKKYESEKMNVFFYYCTRNLENRSVISGKFIPSPNKLNYHHVYEKSSNPELKYSISNIAVITGDEHQHLNGDLEYYEVIAEKRLWIKEHWEECVAESDAWSEEYDNLKK